MHLSRNDQLVEDLIDRKNGNRNVSTLVASSTTSSPPWPTYSICLLEVEDKIQLAHVAKVSIQHLDVSMDDLERHQLVVALADSRDKEERCVSPIHDFAVLVLEEVAHPRPSSEHELCDIFGDLELCLGRHGGEPFRKADLALSADEKDPVDLRSGLPSIERSICQNLPSICKDLLRLLILTAMSKIATVPVRLQLWVKTTDSEQQQKVLI